MFRSLTSTLLLTLLLTVGKAQIQVNKFSPTSGGKALTNQIKDHNGQVCAHIRITTVNLDDTQRKRLMFYTDATSEIHELSWTVGAVEFYISPKAEFLEIAHPDYSVLRYVFKELIQPKRDYELILEYVPPVVEEVPKEIESQWLVITPYPENAMVYLDGLFVANGQYQSKQAPGEYTYKVEAPLYHSKSGTIRIRDQKEELNIRLEPAHGFIRVESKPEQGAKVMVDGRLQTAPTPMTTGPLASGEHSIQVLKEMFTPFTQKIIVSDGQTNTLYAELQPNFAEISLQSLPRANLYVNGSRVGTGSWQGRLSPGVYSLEAKLDKHHPAKQDIQVQAGKNQSLELQPQAMLGNLDIMTTPAGATIVVDGKQYGTSPQTIKNLLIGDYNISLTKEGYTTINKKVSVSEGQSILVSEKLTEKTVTTSQTSTTSSRTSVIEPEMVFVKGGTFTMGATSEQNGDAENNEKPAHNVILSDYYIGKYEVTQAQWESVMGNNPSYFKGDPHCPVENVSWDDVQEYINKLNELTGKTYRLPTEAEWEYAARGGVNSNGYKYSGSRALNNAAWFWDNSDGKTHPVGTKKPNELGIYDMSGNVWEWCSDWHASDYYSSSPQTNPQGPSSGSRRVIRGGGWNKGAGGCRVSYRDYGRPDYRYNYRGFRLVLVTDEKPTEKTVTTTQTSTTSSRTSVIEPEMVFVKGGTFTMGATSEQGFDAESDEKPAHNVTLSDYYIGKYEITQAQWKAVMGNNPSNFEGYPPYYPVERVSWNDVQEYIKKLNQLTGKTYRLPTEAEWEYAARGGSKRKGYKYSGNYTLSGVAWYYENSNRKTHPIGIKKLNELGIYDMSGNVWEWCSDWYASDYYSSSPQTNPQGPSSGSSRVIRGGSWDNFAGSCRVSFRGYVQPDRRRDNLGFRLVLVP